ncbi:Transaldolase [Labilithrix luteola]|uniref:Transaldolase n=1 Tax=Labilithrix luteola TaxID=1391654 RepID=A0A0K1PPD8_9BACT|nr:transaldolase [Labilithrix luteola]AKU95377.1 Transaldolase [Labilithrix luteola]
MSKNLLEQLKSMTVVVSDTGDFNSVEKFRPRDATTNPSLIAAAAAMPAYAQLTDEALAWARAEGGASKEAIANRAVDRLAVEFGLRILKIVPGRVSTEVDARLSYDTQASVDKAHTLIKMYEAAGASRDRILIKLASTWEGARAAEILEKEGIHCNMTLLFGMHQAIACADAKATLISPFVGRILDWYKKDTGRESYPSSEDPGVVSVTKIFNYYKHHDVKTEVMGASFRNIGEITELAGCDLLTIAPNLLAELEAATGDLPRKLDAAKAKAMDIPHVKMDEATFRAMHEQDRMAKDKLHEGIEGFSKALVALEKQLVERL